MRAAAPKTEILECRKVVSRGADVWYLCDPKIVTSRQRSKRGSVDAAGKAPAIRPRRAYAQVLAALAQARVVVLNGPRQAGKTTLAHALHRRRGGTFISFDDRSLLDACLDDPRGFLSAHRQPLIIDEFQRAGDGLLYALKLLVDTDRQPGRFLLTGSTRFLTVPTISESLAGRVAIVDLWPFTQGEADGLGGSGDSLLRRLLDPAATFAPEGTLTLTRANYLERICRGGFPEVHQLEGRAERLRWFRDYIRTVALRDIPEISHIRQASELPKLLRALAAWSGSELNASSLAERIGIDRVALARNYLPILETVYLLRLLPAWSRNLVSRVARHPKAFITDSGVAAFLLGADAAGLARPGAAATGGLVETFVVGELLKQASLEEDLGATLHHFRGHDGPEIDIVAETPDARIACIEVKASSSVRSSDFRHLIRARDALDRTGERFVRGAVLYSGSRTLPFGDRLVALPIACLWLPPRRARRAGAARA